MWNAEAILALLIMLGIALVALAVVAGYIRRAYFVPRARAELRACVLETLASAARRGLPLAPVLEAAAQDRRWGPRRALARAHAALAQGMPLSEALGQAGPAWFPRRTVAALRAAEESGDLAGALAAGAKESVESLSLASALQLGLFYPIVVLLGLSFTQVFIYPRFIEIAEGLGRSLPPLAQLGVGMGEYLIYLAFALVVGSIVIPLISWWPVYGILVERALDVTQYVPVARRFAELRGAERALLALTAFVKGGKPLGEALRRAAPAAGYSAIVDSIGRAAEQVEKGVPADVALAEVRWPTWARVRAGAALAGANARVAEALVAIADECARRRQEATERAIATVYPVSIILLAVPIFLMYATNFIFMGIAQKGSAPW